MNDETFRAALAVGRAFGQLKEGLIESTLDHRVIFVNDYGSRLASFDNAKELLAKDFRTYDLFVDRADHDRLMERLNREGTVDNFVCQMRDFKGNQKWIEITANLVRDGAGRPFGYWGVFRDLTPRIEAEQARDRLNQQLLDTVQRLEASERLTRQQNVEIEARNDSLREFAASVIHDLKAPLTSLKGFAEMLFDCYGPALDERGRHLIERIRFNGEQMDLIMRGLQELVLLEVESEPKRRIDPAQIMQTVLTNRREQVAASGVQVQIQETLPELFVHPTKLYQLLDNLLSNSLKALDGRKDPWVSFGFGGDRHPAAFFVEDNGPGIPPDLRERVFEPFFRGDNGRPGSGIGLSIVRRVVALYGGRVWAEEGSRGGARFCFELPQTG